MFCASPCHFPAVHSNVPDCDLGFHVPSVHRERHSSAPRPTCIRGRGTHQISLRTKNRQQQASLAQDTPVSNVSLNNTSPVAAAHSEQSASPASMYTAAARDCHINQGNPNSSNSRFQRSQNVPVGCIRGARAGGAGRWRRVRKLLQRCGCWCSQSRCGRAHAAAPACVRRARGMRGVRVCVLGGLCGRRLQPAGLPVRSGMDRQCDRY